MSNKINNTKFIKGLDELLIKYPEIVAVERLGYDFSVRYADSLMRVYFNPDTPADKCSSIVDMFEEFFNSDDDSYADKFTNVTSRFGNVKRHPSTCVIERGVEF